MAEQYKTIPEDTEGMPSGVPYIIGNEAAERFSYYGMRSILVVFMTSHMLDRSGAEDFMSKPEAIAKFADFTANVYFFPIFGALLADGLLGKYRTIFWVSILYCLGHLVLSLDPTRWGLDVGLMMIAIGSGGIKPCVSANVGDQFGPRNQNLLERVYSWFYFSINAGSMFSTILIPWLLVKYGPHVAFAVPGILMALATFVFWLGRNNFVHAPPSGLGFVREALTREGLSALRMPVLVCVFVSAFWCLYDQSASAWVLQAEKMDLHAFGREWLAPQIHTLNPVLILAFIPLFSYVVYPTVNRFFRLTPVRKIAIGLFLTALSFVVSAWIEIMIERGETPTVYWQGLAYIVLTAAEVMVSVTGLEFSYSVAPKSMKSIVMAIWLFSVSLGSRVTWAVNTFIQNEDKTSKLPGDDYYWFFAGFMLVAAVGFSLVAMTFPRIGSDEAPSAAA